MKLLFEIFNREGQRIMWTVYRSCVPDYETLRCVYQGGYYCKVNGKKMSLTKIKEWLANE